MLHIDPRLIVFRPTNPAAPNLPLRVRSVGRSGVAAGWVEPPRRAKWFAELYWGIEGVGEFRVEDRWMRLERETIFIYRPGEIHHLRAVSERWRFCWITFDHPDCLRWIEGFGLNGRIHSAGECPQTVFVEIASALRACTAEGERTAAHLAHSLLMKASANPPPASPGTLPARAKTLMDRLFCDPAIGINEIADRLQVHRTTLFRQFTASHELKPSAYLHNLRVQRGLALLRESAAPIHEIARAAGFADPNYFSRAIREATSLSPREFRES